MSEVAESSNDVPVEANSASTSSSVQAADDPVPADSNGDTSTAIGKTDQAAKKKRGADRQMTKDDYEGEDDDGNADGGDNVLSQGFQRASEEVLAKRRIIKVSRPTASNDSTKRANPFGGVSFGSFGSTNKGQDKSGLSTSTQTQSSTTATAPEKPATNSSDTNNNSSKSSDTLSAGTSQDVDSAKKPTKVFGSSTGFTGFKTASSSSTGTGFGGFGSSNATSTTTGFGTSGFGSAFTSSNSKDKGESTDGFGTTSSSSFGGGFTFGGGNTSAFGSAFKPINSKDEDESTSTSPFLSSPPASKSSAVDDAKEDEGDEKAGESVAAPAPIFPENVSLQTGEEGERVIFEGRCKSYVQVPVEMENDKGLDDENKKAGDSIKDGETTNPSVKPSDAFQSLSKSQSSDDADSESASKSVDKAVPENQADDKKATTSESKSSTSKSTGKVGASWRWQEKGIGPIKILQDEENPNKFRIVHRQEGFKDGPGHALLLNRSLWKESACTYNDAHAQKICMIKGPKAGGGVEVFTCKFGDPSKAGIFMMHVNEAISQARSAFGS